MKNEMRCENCEMLQQETRRRIAAEAEVLRISETERLRLNMDLHDDICQRLAGISMFCKSLTGEPNQASRMPEISRLIDETLIRIRDYTRSQFPAELDTQSLKKALNNLCRSTEKYFSCQCALSWSFAEESPFGPGGNLNIYRIVQEAVQNAVRHGRAQRIDVKIEQRADVFIVIIHDDGKNDEKSIQSIKSGGLGFRSMHYRARQLGGLCKIEPLNSNETGTKVEIQIPLAGNLANVYSLTK